MGWSAPLTSIFALPRRCCWRVPLRTGALATGVFLLVANILLVAGSVAAIPVVEFLNRTRNQTVQQFAGRSDASGSFARVYNTNVVILQGCLIASIGFPFANIAFNSFLIHGVRKEVARLVSGWVVWYGVLNGLTCTAWLMFVVYNLIGISWLSRAECEFMAPFLVGGILGGGLAIGLLLYLYACVLAYYQNEVPHVNEFAYVPAGEAGGGGRTTTAGRQMAAAKI